MIFEADSLTMAIYLAVLEARRIAWEEFNLLITYLRKVLCQQTVSHIPLVYFATVD
ncbi:hypothetical protein [Halalkalibacter lacteus]|uniref:hypothetical protein n=1 Tax=Halalkalibacter lacteus TaxID=3090663 RepID=UPI002FC634AC